MQAMQYKINLPNTYDMELIKKRARLNGHKTDGFEGLLFKAYLVSEINADALVNSYCPLYVWKNTEGMSKFIFNGFFDNILDSFGWQTIEIGIASFIDLSSSFSKSNYMVEKYSNIPSQKSLKNFDFQPEQPPSEQKSHELGKVIIYNPEKWKFVTFTFFEQKPVVISQEENIYTILHLSLDT